MPANLAQPSQVAQCPSSAKHASTSQSAVDLDTLLNDQRIWRGHGHDAQAKQQRHVLSTGIAQLDAALPSGGWIAHALNEVLVAADGVGELQLLLPALARMTQARQRVLWVAMPYPVFPQALQAAQIALSYCDFIACVNRVERSRVERSRDASHNLDSLWAAEQVLRAGCCEAVLLWSQTTDDRALRRLQIAAEEGQCSVFLFRPLRCAQQASPAALRIAVHAASQRNAAIAIDVEVLKCRGGYPQVRELQCPHPALCAA